MKKLKIKGRDIIKSFRIPIAKPTKAFDDTKNRSQEKKEVLDDALLDILEYWGEADDLF